MVKISKTSLLSNLGKQAFESLRRYDVGVCQLCGCDIGSDEKVWDIFAKEIYCKFPSQHLPKDKTMVLKFHTECVSRETEH